MNYVIDFEKGINEIKIVLQNCEQCQGNIGILYIYILDYLFFSIFSDMMTPLRNNIDI